VDFLDGWLTRHHLGSFHGKRRSIESLTPLLQHRISGAKCCLLLALFGRPEGRLSADNAIPPWRPISRRLPEPPEPASGALNPGPVAGPGCSQGLIVAARWVLQPLALAAGGAGLPAFLAGWLQTCWARARPALAGQDLRTGQRRADRAMPQTNPEPQGGQWPWELGADPGCHRPWPFSLDKRGCRRGGHRIGLWLVSWVAWIA